MPSIFNVNQPITEGQLAALYNNPHKTPQEIESDMFLNSSQGYDFIQNQARNLGIGDPAQYFSQKQLAARMDNSPSGFDMEMARLAGTYGPDTLPGQLQRREKAANALMVTDAAERKQMQDTAHLQRMTQYPLPAVGHEPELSPVMEADMASRNITDPTEYIMAMRLGGRAGQGYTQETQIPMRSQVELIPKPRHLGQFDMTQRAAPGAMFREPSMQVLAKKNPGEAAKIFEAMTGGHLENFGKSYGEAQDASSKAGGAYLRDALEKRRAILQGGKVLWQQQKYDPMEKKFSATDQYGEGDIFQKSQEQYLSEVDAKIQRQMELEAAGPPAGYANTGMSETPDPRAVSTGNFSAGDNLWDDFAGGVLGDIGRSFTGGGQNFTGYGFESPARQAAWAPQANQFAAPEGAAPIHARPLLEKNTEFQRILKTDPARARRIILAIQQRGMQAMPEPEAMPRYIPPVPTGY